MEEINEKKKFCRKVSAKLAEERRKLGYTSNKIRESIGVDVNKIENRSSNLSVFTLYRILNFYGMSMSEFFEKTED